MSQRAEVALQQFELMLREIADAAVLAAKQVARLQGQVAGERSHQRGLPGAVRAEHADPRAGCNPQRLDRNHRFAVVAERCVLELNQHR